MKRHGHSVLASMVWLAMATTPALAQDQPAAPLPRGIKAVWDLTSACRETTSTRERICINGLWRCQPAEAKIGQAPTGNWGFFKVPGPWPEYRVRAWMAEESQKIYRHPSWEKKDFRTVDLVWHEREIQVPEQWAGRRITLWTEWLNSTTLLLLA